MHQPRAVVLCFGPDAASYRTELYPAYHAKRGRGDARRARAPVRQAAATSSRPSAGRWRPATISRPTTCSAPTRSAEAEAGGHALLMTGDRDMYQCAGKGVTVLYVRTGGKGAEEVGPDGGARALRHRAGAGARLHRPARRPVRRTAWSQRRRDRRPRPSCCASTARWRRSSTQAIREQRPKLRAALIDGREDLLAFKDIATLRDAGVEPPPDRADRLGRRRGRRPRAGHEPPRRAPGVSRPVASPRFVGDFSSL